MRPKGELQGCSESNQVYDLRRKYLERCQSGRMGLIRNQVYGSPVPWVRIPPSPPKIKLAPSGPVLFLEEGLGREPCSTKRVSVLDARSAPGGRGAEGDESIPPSPPINQERPQIVVQRTLAAIFERQVASYGRLLK